MKPNKLYIAGLYCRLSKDDESSGESVSIGTQKSILIDYCIQNHYEIYKIYVDDGYSGMNFKRPGFQELLEDVERGFINMVITKDLSRLGRDYIMTGYYSEIFFQTKGIRYIALADDVDSLMGMNELAPFKNILNDMYARDISKKIKSAKRQRAKQGLFIGSQTPFGYTRQSDNKNKLIPDSDAAEVVTLIFSLAQEGLGDVAIASELKKRRIVTPSVYKYQHGDKRFSRYQSVKEGNYYSWCPATVGQILKNRVYTGTLVSLKTETVNCKTKQKLAVPKERQVFTYHAHEAIITEEQFNLVQKIRSGHSCPAKMSRENLFRGKLLCQCCGHPMTIAKKKLVDRETEIYTCMHHYRHPNECPKTHQVYYDVLYSYVLQQIRAFAKSMTRRNTNLSIGDYADIEEITPEILDRIIEQIEVGHFTRKSKPGNVIKIYWKLNY